MCSAELKCLKPHTDGAKNMQNMAAIYIPGFCRLHPAFNSGPKRLMTKQNLNFYFCYMKREILQRRHIKLAEMSCYDFLHGAPHKDDLIHEFYN
jgi:hypothetical protein